MNRSLPVGRGGLTVIEVLVAIALLAIVSAGILASLSLTNRLNRDASEDVDYSRVVRSAMERIAVVWDDPARWDDEFTDTAEVNTFVQSLSTDCSARLVDPVDDVEAGLVVRVLEITCGGPGTSSGLAAQAFQQEFGAP